MRKIFAAVALVCAVLFAASMHSPPLRSARAQQAGGQGLVALGNGWNVGAVSSGSAVFGSDLVPSQGVSTIRMTIVLTASAPVAFRETDGLGHTFTSSLNGGTALSANCYYTFVIGTRAYSTSLGKAVGGTAGWPTGINVVIQSPASVNICRVEEVTGGTD